MQTITAWQRISPEVNVKGFLRSAACPMQWMGLMMLCSGMAGKEVGTWGVSVRKMKALIVKMETATLIGKSR